MYDLWQGLHLLDLPNARVEDLLNSSNGLDILHALQGLLCIILVV